MRRFVLTLFAVVACQRAPAMSHEQIAKFVAERLQQKDPDTRLEILGDEIILHRKDGLGRLSLKAAWSVCAQGPARCEDYVDRIAKLFDHEEDEEEVGHRAATSRATSAAPH